MLIYNFLKLSHLNFGILLWGYKCEKVFKLQKEIVRILSLSTYNAHTDVLLKKMKLLKISDILKLQQLKFITYIRTINYHTICKPYHFTLIQELMIIILV